VHRLGAVSKMDERTSLGCIRLHTEDGVRCWDATDTFAAVRFLVEDDPNTYDVLVPHTLIRFGLIAGGAGPNTTLQVSVDEDLKQYLRLTGMGGSLTVERPEHEFPDFDQTLEACGEIAAQAKVNAGYLYGLIKATRVSRFPLEDDDEDHAPDYGFSISDQGVGVEIDWPGLGRSTYRVFADVTGNPVSRVLAPRALDHLVKQFESSDEVTITVPDDETQPVFFGGTSIVGALQPRVKEDPLRERVEIVIDEAVDMLGVQRNELGDYPLHRRVVPVFGRLDDNNPTAFQVFAVIVDEVLATTDLLVELNDLNRNLGFARLIHADRQVVAQVDLPAATMVSDELSDAIECIVDIAERVMPMLAAVYGGHEAVDPESSRWDAYRSMVIEAEVRPGKSSRLNGERAASAWPFPGPVYVLSGWNPQGVAMDDLASDSVNAMISQDILLGGGRFVHGRAFLPDGDHSEPSLIAWGLGREDAITIGRKASRDAIFRIDADEVRLLSCTDDRTVGWPRRGSSA